MGSLMGSLMTVSMSYLPTVVQDICLQSRSFATAKLPSDGSKCLCGFATVKGQECILVASSDGFLYIYEFDAKNGGQCTLLKQHDFVISQISEDVVATVAPETDNREKKIPEQCDNSMSDSPLNNSGSVPSI